MFKAITEVHQTQIHGITTPQKATVTHIQGKKVTKIMTFTEDIQKSVNPIENN